MKKSILVSCCFVLLFLSSCAVQTTAYHTNDVTQTTVVLSQNNYRIVKPVTGIATQTYIFGFGGPSQKALENNSRGEMFKNANLQAGQTIINISTTTSVKTILMYTKRYAVTTGYVIEFTNGTSADN